MIVSTVITFSAPRMLAVAACLFAALATVVILRRKLAMPRAATILILLGGACAVLAAGEPIWRDPRAWRVLVMVDISPSTRGAAFRDVAALRERIAQLLGGVPFDLIAFPGNTPIGDAPPTLPETRVQQTSFVPPPGTDAILLFSDGRFDPPAAFGARIYPVIDPNLEDPQDAAVERLAVRDAAGNATNARRFEAVATFSNRGPPRNVQFSGATIRATTVPAGETVVTSPLAVTAEGEREISVALRGPRDRWPENDSLLMRVPLPQENARWWVGDSSPPAGWTKLKPEALPTDPADYLAPAVIVLDNVAVDRLLRPHHERLTQYVRELGGGLVILGGDHAFAAGGYPGTSLEALSPLASSPPEPTTHWILLADASGSMAASVGDNTKLTFASSAIRALVPRLPPDDPVSIGSFARDLRWWSRGKTARQLDPPPMHPDNLRPQGPTDLAPALRKIAAAGDARAPTELLLITDAEAMIDNVDELVSVLARDRIRLHLLGTKDIDAANPVRRMVEKTGGTYVTESDPRQWVVALRRLMRSAAPPRVMREPITVRFVDGASDIPPRQTSLWNRTWFKPLVAQLAVGQAKDETVPAAAGWNVGEGAVVAAAFQTDAATAESLARRVILPPRDPRLKVTWDAGAKLRVVIDALENERTLNNLDLRLELFPVGGESPGPAGTKPAAFSIPQTAPGRYVLSVLAPRAPAFARVRLDGRPIDRVAVAGRYAPEFDEIGNDRAAMKRLAADSGGEVVEPTRTTPLEIRPPRGGRSLRIHFALAAAIFVALGLIRWRLG